MAIKQVTRNEEVLKLLKTKLSSYQDFKYVAYEGETVFFIATITKTNQVTTLKIDKENRVYEKKLDALSFVYQIEL